MLNYQPLPLQFTNVEDQILSATATDDESIGFVSREGEDSHFHHTSEGHNHLLGYCSDTKSWISGEWLLLLLAVLLFIVYGAYLRQKPIQTK